MFQGMEYVYQVYKDKSFSKAAANLFISQPSLSANVKLRRKKGWFPIFDRSTKPLSLTSVEKNTSDAWKKFSQWKRDFRSLSMILTIWKQEL